MLRSLDIRDVLIIDRLSLTLGPGESFSIGAVMAQRASTSSYTALDDVFCYELSAESFFALLQKSAVLNFFCTQYLASLLGQSRQQLQLQFSQHVAEQQTMNSPLAAIIKRAPLSVTPQTPIRRVVELMAASSVGNWPEALAVSTRLAGSAAAASSSGAAVAAASSAGGSNTWSMT